MDRLRLVMPGLGPGIHALCGAIKGAGRHDGEVGDTAALTSTRLRAGIAHSTGSAAACRQKPMTDDPDEIPKEQKEFRMRQDS
jgi:hypothetical protein